MFLAFMMGMGLSFALSALSLKSNKVTFLLSCAVFSLILLAYPLNIIPTGYLLPPLSYWVTKNTAYLLVSVAQSALLALVGVVLMKEHFEMRQQRYDESFLSAEAKFAPIGQLKTMVAKEWLELVRSGSLFPAVTGYQRSSSRHLFHLVALSDGLRDTPQPQHRFLQRASLASWG